MIKLKKILIIFTAITLLFTGCQRETVVTSSIEETYLEGNEVVMDMRSKIDDFSNLGNPEMYDKDRSLMGWLSQVIFVLGGIYFIGQDIIRRLRGKSYEDYYRPFWKDEPFGLYPEFEDHLGNTIGTSREGRGMLGYKSYGEPEETEENTSGNSMESSETAETQQTGLESTEVSSETSDSLESDEENSGSSSENK